jgi:hypothetical protein
MNLAPGAYPDPVEASKSTSKLFAAFRYARHSPLPCPLRTHSKARKPIPFIGLIHGSLDTQGWVQGALPPMHRCFTPSFEGILADRAGRRAATIPFRITSFADPHPLTLIESHSYKKQGGASSSSGTDFYSVLFKLNTFLEI